ncbi:hypothetical protein HHI36_012053 [Cryptolaemus montrouzieri]|uniref:Uncharacterized protein n=1 Tax=Cryptolaemus montrouzieri TaxID=559131 RepID=A0ABD2NDI3_9CUCU
MWRWIETELCKIIEVWTRQDRLKINWQRIAEDRVKKHEILFLKILKHGIKFSTDLTNKLLYFHSQEPAPRTSIPFPHHLATRFAQYIVFSLTNKAFSSYFGIKKIFEE